MKRTKVDKIYSSEIADSTSRPMFSAKVPAGFPSPADDYIESSLDLNRHLIKHPAATFFVRVSGDSMIEAGIQDGDILIVDRSLAAQDRSVVIAKIDGELTVKRIRIHENKLELIPENADYKIRAIDKDVDFEVWGVVIHAIHSF